MHRRSWTALALLTGTLSFGCLSDISLPPLGAAFVTDASSYTLEPIGNSRAVTINWTYTDESGAITALQGCAVGVARWTLEKQVGNAWQEVYPTCTANENMGMAVTAFGTAQGSLYLLDVDDEAGTPRISHRPITGTYRLRFAVFENISLGEGTGSAVTDDRRYSNTFTLQEG